ncbi:MAG: NAD(P)-binding protein [Desulfobacterales bacterium]|nr:NAD(P)-binding protein [Desulfobacterales bacterium]
MTSGRRLPVRVAPDTGKRIAVVGGGPAGLTCAYFLRRLGHQRHHLRGHAQAGRHAALRDPGVPAAQAGARLGDREHPQPGCRSPHRVFGSARTSTWKACTPKATMPSSSASAPGRTASSRCPARS